MSLIQKISLLQNFLPEKLKHFLLIQRRKAYWKEKGIIFIHIPKAAGVSINYAIYGRFMGHVTAAEILKYAPSTFQNYPSFAITRNPWDRCVSSYLFVKEGKGKGEGPVAGVSKKDQYRISAFNSFESFVYEWLVNQDLQKIDYVFRPQLPYIINSNKKIIVSHVGKIEEMNTVQAYLSKTLGYSVNIGHYNKSKDFYSSKKFYNQNLVDTVGKIYVDDIESFGYSFE